MPFEAVGLDLANPVDCGFWCGCILAACRPDSKRHLACACDWVLYLSSPGFVGYS